MKLPKIRKNLIVQDLNDEVLIYDLTTNKSYCLNSTARTVFNYCDGEKSSADLNLPEEIIYLALDELRNQKLIQSDYVSPFAGMSRRAAIRKVGFASMVALPVISSLVAPSAAHAQSAGCATDADCPPAATPCQNAVCANSACGFTSAPAGTSAGNGQICDGSGNAVSCLSANDCPGQDTPCQTRTCTGGACGFSFAPANTPVAPGFVCDGSGNVVAG